MNFITEIFALLVGTLCGIGEFFLLKRFTNAITSGQTSKLMLIVLLKLGLMFASLLIVALIAPKTLWIAGVAMAAILIGCASGSFYRSKNKK